MQKIVRDLETLVFIYFLNDNDEFEFKLDLLEK